MPVNLDLIAGTPPWNPAVLYVLWIAQFLVAGIFEIYTYMVATLLDFRPGRTFTGRSFVISTLILNFAILCAVPYEAYLFSTKVLSAKTYFRFQAAKSAYVLVFLILTVIDVRELLLTWPALSRLAIYSAPFAGSLWHAFSVRRQWAEILTSLETRPLLQ